MPKIVLPDMNFGMSDEPKLTWDQWLAENQDTHAFSKPDWFRGVNKGDNRCDFSGAQVRDLDIYDAFAEAIDFRGATFENVVFEEGDFSYGKFDDCSFLNTRFNKTILTNACFAGATFRNCNLNRANLAGANFRVKEITETVVYGISAWDLDIGEDSKQSKLVIEKSYEFYSDMIERGEVPMMVDDIEMAQFVYYLTNHKKLRNTLDILNQKGVLLLGKFKDGGLDRLYHLRDWFAERNYLPMIFDFQRPQAMDYTETVITMAGLARVVVADLSGPSVSYELGKVLGDFRKPVICYTDASRFSMLRDLQRHNPHMWVLKFDGSNADLTAKMGDVLVKANDAWREIIKDLAESHCPPS